MTVLSKLSWLSGAGLTLFIFSTETFATPTLKSEECSNDCKGGLVYSLPKGQILLQASRLPATVDLTAVTTALQTASDNLKKDQQALATAKAKLATDKAGKTADQNNQPAGDAKGGAEQDAPTSKPSPDVIAADNAAIDAATSASSLDQALLQLAESNFDKLQKQQGQLIETFTLTQLPIAADPKIELIAKLNHRSYRDDSLKVDQSSGLLTSASTSTTDETVNAVVSLAQTGISIATFALSGVPLVPPNGTGGRAPEGRIATTPNWTPKNPAPPPTLCSYQFAEVFDPLNVADVTRVKAKLVAANATIELNVGDDKDGDLPAARAAPASASTMSGLYYRQATAVVVHVSPVDDPALWAALGPKVKSSPSVPGPDTLCPLVAKPSAVAQLIVVPDTRHVYSVDANSGIFTTSTHSYTFTSGMLTEHAVSRPSELIVPVQAINTIVQSILAIPGSIFQLRLNYANNSDSLIKAQTQLATDRTNVTAAAYAAQTQIEIAKSALITSQYGVPQASLNGQAAVLNSQGTVNNAQSALVTGQVNNQAAFATAETNLINAEQALKALIATTTSATAPASPPNP